MGLSASQARLLSLTARMHDIEYKAQKLEAQKLQMANKSTQVYNEYEEALNKQKIQFKTIGSDGSATYKNASVSTLLDAGYHVKILSGNQWIDYTGNKYSVSTDADKWTAYSDKATLEEVSVPADAEYKSGDYVTIYHGSTPTKAKLAENIDASSTARTIQVQVYEALATQPDKTTLTDIDLTSPEVLENLVNAGFIVFEKFDTDDGFYDVNVATDTNLQEVSDDVDLKKAEAKYEADMQKINTKDKKFDTDIAALEQERNAIKTEMDTLKTVAKDNVERTFKLFS